MSHRKKEAMKTWQERDFRQKVVGFVVIVVFAGLGIYLLQVSHAASPYATSSAVAGQLGGSACSIQNSTASSGSAVQFGGCTTVGASANDIFIWTGCGDIEGLNAAELTAYKSAGIAGFVCEEPGGYLPGFGGYSLTSDLSNPDLACGSTNTTYSQEQSLICSDMVAKMHAAGLKIYFDAYLDNYYNTAAPLEPWFDNTDWTGTVEPAISTFASIGKQLGFDGLAFDSESYSAENQGDGSSGSWNWNGPSWKANTAYTANEMFNNAGVTYVVTKAYTSGATFGSTDTSNTTVYTYTQAQTNTEVTLRGQQLMGWIAAAFPNVQILNFGINFPNTWDSYIVQVDDNGSNAFANTVYVPFWDGMTSQNNFSNISIYDEDFYKGPNIAPNTATTLANGLQYNANSYYAVMSQNFSNWAYAADRVDIAPAIWIDGIANGGYSSPLSVASATPLMDAYTQWSVGNILMDYAYNDPASYDYSPFYTLFENIAKQTIVETTPPTLTVSSPSTSSTSTTSSTINMSGSSTDSFAIRDVKWTNSANGDSGAGTMTWVINSGTYTTTYNSQTNWSITGIPLQSGTNKITITAENIHGLTTSSVVTVTET